MKPVEGGGSTGADTPEKLADDILGDITANAVQLDSTGAWRLNETKARKILIARLQVAAPRVETAPDDIEKLVRDWYYAPGKIVGPDNLAAFVREIVAAQAAEIERLTQALEERNNRGTGFLYCPAASRDKWKSRAEAAEALVEEMRTKLENQARNTSSTPEKGSAEKVR